MKPYCCILLILISVLLGAEDTPELLKDEYPDRFTEDIYLDQEQLRAALHTAYSFAAPQYFNLQGSLDNDAVQVYGSLRLREARSTANLQLRYKDALALGNYRLAWAEGLILSKSRSNNAILKAPHSTTYCPQGMAVELKHRSLWGLAFASRQNRDARLIDRQISLLPRSKTDYLANSRESIYGAGISVNVKGTGGGILYYHQHYDRAFCDTEQDSLLDIFSVYAVTKLNAHQLRAECSLQDRPSFALAWDMRSSGFQQSWSYTRLQTYQKPAYAARVLRLHEGTDRDELSASLAYTALKGIDVKASATMNKSYDGPGTQNWLGEHKLSLDYRQAGNCASLSVTGLDREILSVIDSSYVSSIPRHYRVSMRLSRQISDPLRTFLAFRYHHQEKTLALKTGSWWEQGIAYAASGLGIKLSYRLWQSGSYPMLIPDESEEGYQSFGKNSLSLVLKADYRISWLLVKLSLDQDMKHHDTTRGSLSLNVYL